MLPRQFAILVRAAPATGLPRRSAFDKVRPQPAMSIACPHCAASMPETAAFCPGCGRPMQTARANGRVGVFPENIAGALGYLSFIPAIVLLLLAPYNKNRFVRFHSFQCLFLWAALLLIGIALKLVGFILLIIPVLGHLLVVLMSMVVALAAVVIWLVLIVKALQGESFKIPVLGEFAEHMASAY
jgi:uncharacterized membrane protein